MRPRRIAFALALLVAAGPIGCARRRPVLYPNEHLRSVGSDAAGGGTRGLLRGMRASRNPDPIERRFVEECLAERGYKPIGWR